VLPPSDGIELIVSRVCDIESRIRTTYVMKLDHRFVPGNIVQRLKHCFWSKVERVFDDVAAGLRRLLGACPTGV
jgi:hypothetical protein